MARLQPAPGSSLPGSKSITSIDEEWKGWWWRDSDALDVTAVCESVAVLDFRCKTECLALARSAKIFERLTAFAYIHLVHYRAPVKYLESLRAALRSWDSWDDQQLLSKHHIVRTTIWECCEGFSSGQPLRGYDPAILLNLDMATIRTKLVYILSEPELKALFFNLCAQEPLPVVNLVQTLLDNDDYFEGRVFLTRIITRFSKKFSCYPDCLILEGVERTGKDPVAGGGFADVWKGTWGGQPVALKALRIYVKSIKEKALKEFAHEATIWRQLWHPNILPFFGVFKGDENFDRLCLVSPWMDSGNVMNYLITFPDANRLELLADVAKGLEYLHNFVSPIVHGDLKGANIFVTSSKPIRACLADFGLTYFRDSSNSASTSLSTGTLRWQAPELFERSADGQTQHPSEKSDIYSFGCVCLELMTGCHPFKEIRSDFGVMKAIMNKETPGRPEEDLFLNGLDHFMWEIMTQCWNSQTDRRPTAEALITSLSQRMGPGQPVTRETGFSPHPRRATLSQYGFQDDYNEWVLRFSRKIVSQEIKDSDSGHASSSRKPNALSDVNQVTSIPQAPKTRQKSTGSPRLDGLYLPRAAAPNPKLLNPPPIPSPHYKLLPIRKQNPVPGAVYSEATPTSAQGIGQLRARDEAAHSSPIRFWPHSPLPHLLVYRDSGKLASPVSFRQPNPFPQSGPRQESTNNAVRSPNFDSANLRPNTKPRIALTRANAWHQALPPTTPSPSNINTNNKLGDLYSDAHSNSSTYRISPQPTNAFPCSESVGKPSLTQQEKNQHTPSNSETFKHTNQLILFPPVDESGRDTIYSWLQDVLACGSSDANIIPEQIVRSKAPSEYVPGPTPSPKGDIHPTSFSTRPADNWVNDNDNNLEGNGDDGSRKLWQTLSSKQELKGNRLGPRPKLSVDTEVISQLPPVAMPSSGSSPYITPPTHPPPPFPPPPPPPLSHAIKRHGVVQSSKNWRGNTRTRDSPIDKSLIYTWASRPLAEDVYKRLEEFFPDHDLDRPVIEATSASGGTSPATAGLVSRLPAAPAAQQRTKHRKSIRLVAAEHKRKIDETTGSDSSSMSSILRKRSTKLWGCKVEDTSKDIASAISESPLTPSRSNPIFKWVRGELIGRGLFGRVYLALNATTGELIAVKQVEIPRTAIDQDDSRQTSVVEALKLESETLKDLDHPNIVQYLGFEQTPDCFSIFLESVRGSVAGCLREHGKFDDQVARSFTGQVLEGLEYLHANGIIHRHLNADNLLVDPSGIIKISDFRISKRTDDIDNHTGMRGSVFWMAPDVISARRAGPQIGYNGKVDIWSLGCVVLEMWAGHRPWPDADAIAVLVQLAQKRCAPPVPEDVILSPVADDFRSKCFAIEPEDRPSASELRTHPYLVLRPGWTFKGFK